MISTIKLLNKLRNMPLFTLNDLSLITKKSRDYLKVYINRLLKKDLIYKIERGKFTVHDNPIIFASSLIIPSYFSLWTALAHYHLTTQIPLEIFVIVKNKKKPIQFQGKKINFIQSHIFGYRKEYYGGIQIFVAEKEKLFIDCIHTNLIPLNQLDELIEDINIQKTFTYLKRTKNKNLAKRIGFLLEEKKKKANKILSLIDANYTPFIKGKKARGRKNKKWKVIDNR